MSRAAGLICAVAVGLSAPAAAEDCPVRAVAEAAARGWVLHVEAPCAPYLPVSVTYGPLVLPEETDLNGAFRLPLPVLPEAVARVEGDGLTVEVAPEAGDPSGFLWLQPRTVAPGALPGTGFPAPGGGVLPELAIFAKGETPDFLDLPVGDGTCGKVLDFDLLRDGWDTAQRVRVTLPPCGVGVTRLRVPLSR